MKQVFSSIQTKISSMLSLMSLSAMVCFIGLAVFSYTPGPQTNASPLAVPNASANPVLPLFVEMSPSFQVPAELPELRSSVTVVPPQIPPLPNPRPGVPILMYHYVGDHYDPKVNTINNTLMHGLAVPTAVFDQQMEHLAARRYRTMSFTELRSIQTQPGPLPADAIVLTFDDGYVDFYTNAYPILKKYNLKATVYVITKFIGRQGYIDWDMIREMQNSGLITIGSHTTMHNNLPSLSLSTLSADLRTSKAELEEKLGVPVEDFCYPSGKYNSDVVNAVGTAGYKTATLTVYGRWFPQNHPLMMPRERVSGYLSIEAFRELY